MRRKNAVVVMAPQQISDIANSQIADVVLENCPTKILLPNAESKNPGSREFYTRVGLNERELEILQVSIPKQHYYIVSKLGRRLVNLGIGKIALSWVGVNGREERQIVESVMEPRIGKHSVRVGTNDDETASENNHPVHCAVADVLRVYEAGASRRDRRNRGGSRFGRFVFNTCSAD